MVLFSLLVGGYDELVGDQIARLSSCGVVMLSVFLSPTYDLNSSTVRNVLRGWIAHGDVAAVWLTQPLTSSTAACLLQTCHQANVVGFYVELIHNTVSHFQIRCVCASRARSMFSSFPSMWTCVTTKRLNMCPGGVSPKDSIEVADRGLPD